MSLDLSPIHAEFRTLRIQVDSDDGQDVSGGIYDGSYIHLWRTGLAWRELDVGKFLSFVSSIEADLALYRQRP